MEEYLDKQLGKQWKLLPGAQTPMRATYQPEVDVSPELSAEFASYYQSLIGVRRWIVELSRVDICLEVLLLSSHLALPREGHFEQLLQDFSYLRKYHNSELIYDPSDPVIDEGQFQRRNWMSSELGHVNRKEEMPPKMPELRGQWVTIHAKVDVDHASDTVTRRSRTRFLVYINSVLVYWWSEKQTNVFRIGVHCDEAMSQVPSGPSIQTMDDGHPM